MSTWRDIWRYGVIANRLFAESEERGEKAFDKLMEVYDRPEKDGKSRQDGMIRYIKAEAYEHKFKISNDNKFKEYALSLYKEAENLFPVEHWKEVAKESYQRLAIGDSPETFYNTRAISLNEDKDPQKNEMQFKKLIWFGFQKTYDFVYLSDFARYVCLSALSRGSSEWPLTLVDFRTVLELEIKQCFSYVIKEFDNETNQYSLAKTIQKLYDYREISETEKASFDNIRMAGNIAAHQLYADNKYKKENAFQFIEVLKFFNSYRQSKKIEDDTHREYPLCQITLEEFIDYLETEKKNLEKVRYYK